MSKGRAHPIDDNSGLAAGASAEDSARFRTFTDASFEVIILSENGIVLDINQQVLSMIGFFPEEIIGTDATLLAAPEFRELVRSNIRNEITEPYEIEALRRDGSRLHVEIHGKTIDYQGRRVRVTAVRDVTETKRLERELRVAKARLEEQVDERTRQLAESEGIKQAIYAALPDIFLLVDFEGRLIDYRMPSEVEFFENPAGLIGHRVADLLSVEAGRVLDSKSIDLMATGTPQSFAFDHGANGQTRNYEARLVSSGPNRILIILRDVSDAHAKDRQLSESEERLRTSGELLIQSQKLEVVGRLTGGVAHDFANYLTIIKGCASILGEKVNSTDVALQRKVQQILKATEQASDLVKELLSFSRGGARQNIQIDLNHTILQMTQMVERLAGPRVHVKIELAENLGYILGGEIQIKQVLLNLVANARDAMDGRGTIEIETRRLGAGDIRLVEPRSCGHFVQLMVRDSGAGISKEIQERIFDPFFTTKDGRGTGIGLTVVRDIVQQQGARIDLFSEPGVGTEFVIEWPEIEVHAAAEGTAGPRPGSGQRILLIEDEEAIREMAEGFLNESGFRVVSADSGAEGLELIQKKDVHFDLVISDVVMPQMSGWHLAATVRRSHPELPIILMSGFNQEQLNGLPLDARVIQKPFELKEFLAAVCEALQIEP